MIRLNRREVLWVFLIGVIYGFIWIACQANRDLDTQDIFWYLNRGQLIWRVDIEGIKLYNPFYPILVGGVNLVVGQVLLSAVILNTLLAGLFSVAVYWLLMHNFNRTIAISALLLLSTHVYFIMFLRQMQTMLLFITLLAGYFILLTHLTRHASYPLALAIGVCLLALILTRLEGIYYGVLLPIVYWVAVLYNGDIWRIARYGLVTLVPLGIVLPLYFIRIFTTELIGGESLFLLLKSTSTPFAVVARAFFDDVNLVLSFWFVGLWLILIIAFVRPHTPHKSKGFIVVGLLLWHISVLFITTQTKIVGSFLYYLVIFIYSAVLIAWGIWTLSTWLKIPRGVWAIVLVVVALNLSAANQQETLSPPLAFATDTYAQDAQIVDQWLTDNQLAGKKIYTLCYNLLGYSHNPMHYLYRYATSWDVPNQWDSPENLLPRMMEQDALFMSCDSVFFAEWQALLTQKTQVPPYQLELVGVPTQNYQFYRVIREN